MRRIVLGVVCLALLSVSGLAAAGPSTAAPPPLTVKVAFAKASYVSGDHISATFSVHNSGTTPVVALRAIPEYGPTDLVLDQNRFGVFDNGATVPAGGTVTVTVSGNLPSLTATTVTLSGNVFDKNGVGVAAFSAGAPVTIRTATVRGQVFGDANANGRADAGEGLSGVKLRLSYRYGSSGYSATTQGQGRFALVAPTATYEVSGAGSGWTVIPRDVTVGPGGLQLSLRAVRPLTHVLTAKLRFTKDTYAVGDTAHIDVTLTNDGSSTLRGIGAACDRVGDPNELGNLGAGWGDLAADGPGVTLAAHQTRTFVVTDKVPAAARVAGDVVVACDFGYHDIDAGYRPSAIDRAKVPGLSGVLDGRVEYYPHGHGRPAVGVAGVRVVLVDASACPLFTRTATTNAAGYFRLGSAPAGSSYKLYLFPPAGWKMRYTNPDPVFVRGNDVIHLDLEVQHGTAEPVSLPTCPSTASQSTPGSSTRAGSPRSTTQAGAVLANTGAAHSAELAETGGAAVLLGIVITLAARRRRVH